jgi:flagellar hook-associated protein 2
MPTITALGSGSGLDLESLVTKLMAVEQAPITALQTQEASYNAKISALGTLKSKLSALQTASVALKTDVGQTALDKFASFTATVADTTIATAKATTGAIAGSYALDITTLARAPRFVSSVFTPTTAPVGSDGDTLTFDFATLNSTRTKTITLDSNNNSLIGLRNAINSAQMGVTASIVNNGAGGGQLVFNGEEGVDNEITLSGTPALTGIFTQPLTARNAVYSINGISATSSSNASSKVLDGVTINLVKEGTTTLTIGAEYAANMTTALNTFITSYNAANTSMSSMGAYNATTKVAGALQGNQVLRDAQTQIRSLIYNTTTGGTSSYQRLSDIGVTVGTDGSLSLNSTKLNNALTADPSAAAELVAKIGTTFNTELEKTVGYSGRIKVVTDSANAMTKELIKRQDALELRLTAIEARYRAQFSSLDTLISKLNSTGSYLTQQLAAISGTSSG